MSLYEYNNSKKINGVHWVSFIVNKETREFATITEFFINQKLYKLVGHVCVTQDIDKHTAAMVFLTSKAKTNIPLYGEVQNIELKKNLFKFVNKTFIIDKETFAHFYIIEDYFNKFPLNVRMYSKKKVVIDALAAYEQSYSHSISNMMFFQNESIFISDNIVVRNTITYKNQYFGNNRAQLISLQQKVRGFTEDDIINIAINIL